MKVKRNMVMLCLGVLTVICFWSLLKQLTFGLTGNELSETTINQENQRDATKQTQLPLCKRQTQLPLSKRQTQLPLSKRQTQLPLSKRHYLCVCTLGRLGNHMFEYASIYGISKRKHMIPLLGKDQLREYFNIWAVEKTKDGRTCKGMKPHRAKRGSAFDLETISFSNKNDTQLKGHMQSFRYFDNVEEDIRRQFQFPTNTVQRAKQILDEGILSLKLSPTDSLTLVAVHVRRADRLKKSAVKFGMTVAPIEYIKHAQDYFLDKYKNAVFVVCSDTIDWCTSNMNASQTMFMKNNPLDIDMAIMLQCSHTIMTVGTFGWWVGWLVNGETIYYEKRVTPGSVVSRQWNMSDHYPAHWIAML